MTSKEGLKSAGHNEIPKPLKSYMETILIHKDNAGDTKKLPSSRSVVYHDQAMSS
jgi:hypothetical protein